MMTYIYLILLCGTLFVHCNLVRKSGLYTYVKSPHGSYYYHLHGRRPHDDTQGRAADTDIISQEDSVDEVPQPLEPLSEQDGVRGTGRTRSSLGCPEGDDLGIALGTNCSSYFDVCVQLNTEGSKDDDIINRYRINCGQSETFLVGKGCVPFDQVPGCKPDPVPEITCTRNGLFSRCEKYVKCTEQRNGEFIKVVTECPDGQVFDETTARCTDRSRVAKCQPFTCTWPGIFRDPRDCRKFHICGLPGDKSDDENAVEAPKTYQCPSGYVFEKREASSGTTCVLATGDDVEACNFNIDVGSPAELVGSDECTEAGFTRDKSVTDCTKFYQCIPTRRYGVFAKHGDYTCPAEGKFDNLLKLCLKEPIVGADECSGRRAKL